MKKVRKIKLKRKQKEQITLLTFIILIASIASILLMTPAFNIKEIKVHGNSVVKTDDVIKTSGIVENVNIFEVSLRSAKKNIGEMGYIEDVKIRRSLPSTIVIDIVEAAGVAYIPVKNGNAIITADGRCLDILKVKDETPKLVKIKGLGDVNAKVGKIVETDSKIKLEELIICLKAFSKKEYVFKMQELDISNISDIKFMYDNKKLNVRVGSTEKIDYKMEIFGPILKEIGEDAEGFIDLERKIYRKKQE